MIPLPGVAVHNAAKAGIIALSQTLAAELAGTSIGAPTVATDQLAASTVALWALGERHACPRPAWNAALLINGLEPADDTALQNSQRGERRLQYVPYLWAALAQRFYTVRKI